MSFIIAIEIVIIILLFVSYKGKKKSYKNRCSKCGRENAMSDYDVDALTKYFNKKNQNKKGDKNGFSKEESSKC